MTSYCIECDALPSECSHDGFRYLDMVKYERIEAEGDGRVMWKVPDADRWRFDNPPSSWPQAAPRALAVAEPDTLEDLTARLECWLEVDYKLADELRDIYAHDPLETSRVIASSCVHLAGGKIRNRGGYVVSRLRKILE